MGLTSSDSPARAESTPDDADQAGFWPDDPDDPGPGRSASGGGSFGSSGSSRSRSSRPGSGGGGFGSSGSRQSRSSRSGSGGGGFGSSGSRQARSSRSGSEGEGFGGDEPQQPRSSGGGSGRQAQPAQSEGERAREICLRQLAVRPRTRAELAKVLARKEISDEVIAEVLDRYDEVGIIDDAAFARAWVSSRHHGRGLARRALANELRQRGVDAETAGEALEAVDDEDEAATARALVDRKLRTATGPPDAVFRRLVAMLARKGYPAGIAFRAVKDALAARDAEAAEFADAVDADALADENTDLS
nr:regulatory protein RecX [Actinoplanes atraurantiacus]